MKKCGAAEEPETLNDIDWRAIFGARSADADLPVAETSPPGSAAALTPRESAAKRPSKKTCHASGSTSSASSGRYVWVDLTDILLYQIILLFSSFHDFLAVTCTCRSWRSAISSFPPVNAFAFPPLYLTPGIRYAHRHIGGLHNLLSNYKWQLNDPAKPNLCLRRSGPRNTPGYMQYLGCSYGYLIFSCREHFLLVDAYTGNKVKPPKLLTNHGKKIYYAILMAPLSSPSSCLLLCSPNSMFLWQVGTSSWKKHRLAAKSDLISEIVFFKGQLFAMNFDRKLSTISFAPHLRMKEVGVVWGDDMVVGLSYYPRLVVCGDMLLMVDLLITGYQSNNSLFKLWSQVFRCDFSAKPAKWVKMEKLENLALFVSFDRKNPTYLFLHEP